MFLGRVPGLLWPVHSGSKEAAPKSASRQAVEAKDAALDEAGLLPFAEMCFLGFAFSPSFQ